MDYLNKKFRFREFKVYKDVRIFSEELKKISKKKFPKEEQFGLLSQLWRALDSIILNIAEGSDRGTDKDFAHFLNNAHTSLNEVVACLDIAFDRKYILTEEHNYFLEKANLLANQLTAFRKKLLNNPCK
jgi:four helix bundle protein